MLTEVASAGEGLMVMAAPVRVELPDLMERHSVSGPTDSSTTSWLSA
jgi:hypothetical protein